MTIKLSRLLAVSFGLALTRSRLIVWGYHPWLFLNERENNHLPRDLWRGEVPFIAVAAGRSHILLLDECGTLLSCGENTYGQTGQLFDKDQFQEVPDIPKVQQVACGALHSADTVPKAVCLGLESFRSIRDHDRRKTSATALFTC